MRATIHTIEAIIGTLILLIGVTSIYPIQGTEEPYFSDDGYSCLEYLDQQGLLRDYVHNNLTDSLNSSLESCLPPITEYTFKICESIPCTTDIPTDESVFLSSYVIAGGINYEPRIVNLWVWLE